MQVRNRKAKSSENVRNGRKGGQMTRNLLLFGRIFAEENKLNPRKPAPAAIRKRLPAAA